MSERVRIPSDLNEEDVFFSLGPIKMSIRQLLLVIGGFVIWYMVANYFLTGLIGINIFFAMVATLWIPLIGLSLAFVKVAGRPLDVWIAEKLAFTFGPRTYIMKDPKSGSGVEANLDSDDDIQALLDYRVKDNT